MAHEDEELYAVVSVSSDNLELIDYTCMPCNQNFTCKRSFSYCGICKKQFCLECHYKHAHLFKEHGPHVLGEDMKNEWAALDFHTEQNRSQNTKENLKDTGGTNKLQVASKKVCNIKVETDKRLVSCNISNCCYLPDARIILTDSVNRCLKLLSEDKYIMAVYGLPDEPHEVCYVDENEIAVTMAGNVVMILQITNLEIKEKTVLTLEHECWGIAFSNDQFYIGDFQHIYVYTREGQQIQMVYSNMSMGKKAVRSFAISEDGNKIYIANYDNHVLRVIDVHGKTIATFEDPALKNPAGVCLGNDGSVFVCGAKSNSIVHVGDDGTSRLGTIARSEGLSSPQSLCFNSIDSSLVVCQQKSNAILVFDIKCVNA